jgi:hypothetical protein
MTRVALELRGKSQLTILDRRGGGFVSRDFDEGRPGKGPMAGKSDRPSWGILGASWAIF